MSSPLSGDSSAGWGQRLRGAPRPQSLPRDMQGQGRPRLDVAPGSMRTLQSDSDPELRTQKKSSLIYWTGKFNFKKQNPSECAEAHPRTFPQQPRTLEGTALACPQWGSVGTPPQAPLQPPEAPLAPGPTEAQPTPRPDGPRADSRGSAKDSDEPWAPGQGGRPLPVRCPHPRRGRGPRGGAAHPEGG